MSRLIDADALVELCDKMAGLESGGVTEFVWKQFSAIVNWQPTIDAVPVVRGRWIDETVTTGTTSGATTVIRQYRCSVCGNLFGRIDDKFCGNCGAKMEAEGN